MSTLIGQVCQMSSTGAHGFQRPNCHPRSFVEMKNLHHAEAILRGAAQEMISTYMEGYPGNLYEEPFVDFSTTRNFALRVGSLFCWGSFRIGMLRCSHFQKAAAT